jgi:hypothetical protein
LFDSIPIAPKVQGASALNQTVIVSLSSDAIASNVSEVYLTNDLGFAKESLSII